MKTKMLSCELYHADVLFIYDANEEEVSNYTAKKHGIILDANRSHCGGVWQAEDNDGVLYVIWVSSRKDLSTLVHEIVHLVMDIFSDRGISVDGDNQEHYAYYLQLWYDKLSNIMRK